MVMMDGVEIIQDDSGEPVLRASSCLMTWLQISNRSAVLMSHTCMLC